MLINPLDYNISELSNATLQKGSLLLSEPFLIDYNFKRSVILVIEHDKNGSLGFVLNKPLNLNINEVLLDFPDINCEVYKGGPVQSNHLFFLHKMGDVLDNSLHIIDDLYWSGDFDQIKFMANNNLIKPEDIKFFLGYSGWEPQQLENEISADSWIITNYDKKLIWETNPDKLWKEALKKMGPKQAQLANFPEDPNLN